MKKWFIAIILCSAFSGHAGGHIAVSTEPTRFDFRSINVAQVVQLIYAEALRDSYVIAPEVLNDQRLVSFRYDGTNSELRSFIRTFFDSLGLEVVRRNGVDFVGLKQVKEPQTEETEVFVYRPKYRGGSYLMDLLSPLLKGNFTARRSVHAAPGDKSPQAVTPPGSAAASIDRDSDVVVFNGRAREVQMLAKLLPQVDISAGEVMVRGVVYEVQTGKSQGSAFSLAASLLSGKLSINLAGAALDNSLKLSVGDANAIFSALSSDSRFKVMTQPSLRVRSGQQARFSVGQDVPILGAISYPLNGQPVQSVEYRSSGVIFNVLPEIRDGAIDLMVEQQLSNFVQTTTGVNTSPTLIKRELRTNVQIHGGEVVLLGGLTEDKDVASHSGLSFLPSFLHTKSLSHDYTELLLVLHVVQL